MKTFVKTFASFLLLLSACAFAQPPDSLWSRNFGGTNFDGGRSVQQTNDDGYILAGYTASYGAGGTDMYLVKTDAAGDAQWSRTFGGGNNDSAQSVQQTNDGGFILAGSTNSFGAGGWNMYLVKTDGNGDALWTRTYGGNAWEWAYAVQQTGDDGYILAGITNSFGAGNYDMYLVKTDAAGNVQWTRTFGGSSDDGAQSVQQTSDGGYTLAGFTSSSGAGGVDMYLVKTDGSGNVQWTRTFGGIGWEWAYSVQQTNDGGYILTGYTQSFGAGGTDMYLVKTDAAGNTQWTRTFGGSLDDWAYSVLQTGDDGYILSGVTSSFGSGGHDMYLVKTDESGNAEWTRTLGGSIAERAHSVQQTADGGYIVAGFSWSFSAGLADMWLVKLGPDGPRVPQDVTISIVDGNTQLNWHSDGNYFYRVYSDATPEMLNPLLEGSTSDTTFVIQDESAERRFYHVVAVLPSRANPAAKTDVDPSLMKPD